MATSGWQNEQTWFTHSSHIRLAGNIRIDGITHSGTNLRVWGAILSGARGDNNYRFYYADYTSYAQPEGGGKIALGGKGKTWKVGDADTVVGFDVTLTGVPQTTTSRSFFVNFYGPNTNSVTATLRWTLYFDQSGNPPGQGWIRLDDVGWDYITATSGVANWGGIPGSLEAIILTGSSDADFDSADWSNWTTKGRKVYHVDTSNLEAQFYMTNSNVWRDIASPLALKGMRRYYLINYAINSIGSNQGYCDWVIKYMPPSPLKAVYTDPGGSGIKDFSVSIDGMPNENTSNYDRAWLSRTIRYKVGDGDWVYVKNDEIVALDVLTTFTVRVPADKRATIEYWQKYHGMESIKRTLVLYNGNAPSNVYGSVDGKSKRLEKIYCSVDGKSKEIIKLYGSVEGKSKAILG